MIGTFIIAVAGYGGATWAAVHAAMNAFGFMVTAPASRKEAAAFAYFAAASALSIGLAALTRWLVGGAF